MKVKIQGFVHWHKYSWEEKGDYRIAWADISDAEWVLVKEQEFEVDIPDNFDPKPGLIKTLREKKSEILAIAHVQAENIEEQIQKLLALEDKSNV